MNLKPLANEGLFFIETNIFPYFENNIKKRVWSCMIFNLFCLLLPWGIFLIHLKNRPFLTLEHLLIIGSFSALIASLINEVGYSLKFWSIKPFEYRVLSMLPYDLGIYTILGVYLVYFIKIFRSPSFLIVSITLITTLFELVLYKFEWIIYSNGWNIFFTFLSYLLAYSLVFFFAKLTRFL